MLAQFYLHLHDVLVAVTSFKVSSQAAVRTGLAHHAPCRVAVIEAGMPFAGQHTAAPYLAVGTDIQVCGGKTIVIPHESRSECLVKLYEPTAIGVQHEIACVIRY